MFTEMFNSRPIWHYYGNSETGSKSKHRDVNELNGKFLFLLSHRTIK